LRAPAGYADQTIQDGRGLGREPEHLLAILPLGHLVERLESQAFVDRPQVDSLVDASDAQLVGVKVRVRRRKDTER
jgi:hypothetical protein